MMSQISGAKSSEDPKMDLATRVVCGFFAHDLVIAMLFPVGLLGWFTRESAP